MQYLFRARSIKVFFYSINLYLYDLKIGTSRREITKLPGFIASFVFQNIIFTGKECTKTRICYRILKRYLAILRAIRLGENIWSYTSW